MFIRYLVHNVCSRALSHCVAAPFPSIGQPSPVGNNLILEKELSLYILDTSAANYFHVNQYLEVVQEPLALCLRSNNS